MTEPVLQCCVWNGAPVDTWAGNIIPSGQQQCQDVAEYIVTDQHTVKQAVCAPHKRGWEKHEPLQIEVITQPPSDEEVREAIESIRRASQ